MGGMSESELQSKTMKELMALADEAAQSAPGDPRILRQLQATLATLEQS